MVFFQQEILIKKISVYTCLVFLSKGINVVAVSLPLSCGGVEVCDQHEASFCCGSCKNQFCCNDLSMKSICEEETEDKSSGSSARMLGVIFGGMVASFVFALVGQALLRRYGENLQICKTVDSEIGDGNSISSITSTLPPPGYEDVHLYLKLEKDTDGHKPAYNFVTHDSGVFSVLKAPVEACDENSTDGSPPSYNAMFPVNLTKSRSSISTISETISEDDGHGVNESVEADPPQEPCEKSQKGSSISTVSETVSEDDGHSVHESVEADPSQEPCEISQKDGALRDKKRRSIFTIFKAPGLF